MSDDFDIANSAFFRSDITPNKRDPVTVGTMKRANVGREYWNARVELIPDSCAYKQSLIQMISNLHLDEKKGKGAIFFGDQGYGKTASAVIMLKEAIARGGQGYLCFSQLVESYYERPRDHLTPEGIPVWEMATRCHFFILDDLGVEIQSAGYKAGDTRIIESLIRARHNNRLPTYITTNLPLAKWAEVYSSFKTILLDPKRFELVRVSGKNWRAGKDSL